jgi:hypothetical protein
VSGANIIYKGECYEYALYHHYSAGFALLVSRGPDGVPTGSTGATTNNWTNVGKLFNETTGNQHRIAACPPGAVDYQGGMVPFRAVWNADTQAELPNRYYMSQDGILWVDETDDTSAKPDGTPAGDQIPGLETVPVILGSTSVRHRIQSWLYDLDRFQHAGTSGAASQYRLYGTADDDNGAGGIYDRSLWCAIMENLRQDVGAVSGDISLVAGTNSLTARAMAVTISCEVSSVVEFERNVLTGTTNSNSSPTSYMCYGIPTGTYDIDVTTSEGTVASYTGQSIASEVALGSVSLYAGDLCGAAITDAPNAVINVIDLNALKANLGKTGSA